MVEEFSPAMYMALAADFGRAAQADKAHADARALIERLDAR
jgi:hypothetical protein